MFTTKGGAKRAIAPHRNIGIFKPILNKKSKQDLAEHKSSRHKLSGEMKSSDISPSVEEFDDMVSKAVGKHSKKKSMFRKKAR